MCEWDFNGSSRRSATNPMRFACIALWFVAGCASAHPAPAETEPATAPARPEPAAPLAKAAAVHPLYADLFHAGRSFTYAVDGESSRYDPDDPHADRHGEVVTRSQSTITCRVTDVRDVPGARLASLDCRDDGNGSFAVGLADATPAGLYAATELGLFRFPLGTAFAPDLDPAALLMPRDPKPMRRVEKLADGENAVEISQHEDGTWCSSRDDMFGDASHRSFCFSPGKGLVSMTGSWDGGSSHSATFTLLATPGPAPSSTPAPPGSDACAAAIRADALARWTDPLGRGPAGPTDFSVEPAADLNGDGRADRLVSSESRGCAGMGGNCMTFLYLSKDDCFVFSGSFYGAAHTLEVLPDKSRGMPDLQVLAQSGCAGRAGDLLRLRWNGDAFRQVASVQCSCPDEAPRARRPGSCPP